MKIGSTEEMKDTENTIMIDDSSSKGERQMGFLYRLDKGCGTINSRQADKLWGNTVLTSTTAYKQIQLKTGLKNADEKQLKIIGTV